jgi:hypothetical protein
MECGDVGGTYIPYSLISTCADDRAQPLPRPLSCNSTQAFNSSFSIADPTRQRDSPIRFRRYAEDRVIPCDITALLPLTGPVSQRVSGLDFMQLQRRGWPAGKCFGGNVTATTCAPPLCPPAPFCPFPSNGYKAKPDTEVIRAPKAGDTETEIWRAARVLIS